MNLIVKTFMVDVTDLQVKYVTIGVWYRDPAVIVQRDQAHRAIEALARRVQSRRSLEADVRKLFVDHVQPQRLDVSVN